MGTDIVDEERIARLLDRGRSRFLAHWYTPDEIVLCGQAPRPERVAGRCLAVKEATWKAIGAPSSGPVRWREIEVLTDHRGHPLVGLRGEAAAYAAQAGVLRLHASTTRTPGWIAAVVVAEG